MEARNIITIINILFGLSILSAIRITSLYSFFYSFCATAILAAVSLAFHWYKNIIVNRPMLVLYIFFILVALFYTFPTAIADQLPFHFVELWYYWILVAIGIYTTFFTKAGFVGVIGNNKKAIKNASLALLSVVTIILIIIIFLGIEGQPRGLRPVFVIFIAYEIAKRYALSRQNIDKVESL